jgi:SAM-dependent MidA family methyltransferase
VEPGLRREPPTDRSDVGEDAGLAARIRAEIRRDGPMPFARFMRLALYDPEGGYYRSAEARPGREGDFITAPELHPIFGATLSRLVQETWDRLDRPTPFMVREIGAGTGALAATLLGALSDTPMAGAIAYEPIEVDERRLAALRERLEVAGLGDALAAVGPGIPDPASPMDGIVIANEVLDALPVSRVRRRGAELRELAVDLDDDGTTLGEVEIDPTTPDLADRLIKEGVELVDGQTAELCLDLDLALADMTAGLRRGLLVLIDYGYPAAELYDPVRRRDGTLRAYVRQQVHDDPYVHIGRQDLTAHVDLTAVEDAARRVGLTPVGSTTQAEALIGLGIEGRLRAIQADPATTMEAYLLVRSVLMRLLDPAAMGRFRVVAYGRQWPDGAPLAAFAYQAPARAPARGERAPRTGSAPSEGDLRATPD